MSNELIVIASTLFTMFGAYTMNPMFPSYNRPFIFQGEWGEPFFMAVNTFFFILPGSLLIWSFLNVKWYVVIMLIMGSMSLADFLTIRLRRCFFSTIFPPLLSLAGLIVLNYLAWHN